MIRRRVDPVLVVLYSFVMTKDELITYTQSSLQFIADNIDVARGIVHVHIHAGKKVDRPRSAFVLCCLARAYACGIPLPETLTKENLIQVYNTIFNESKKHDTLRDRRFVELYGMRFFEYLNEDYTPYVFSFMEGEYSDLYTYPVTLYTFISTWIMCPKLRDVYPFATSLYATACTQMEYILFSEEKNKYNAFHFAEVSLWQEHIPRHVYDRACSLVNTLFLRDVASVLSYTSAIAKNLEHFARVGDDAKFAQGMHFIRARAIGTYSNYLNPNLIAYRDTVYVETKDSQYICLDTSAHILQAYINLYERA